MILAILAAWFGYKKGKDTGRNGFLWAFICAATFIGVQLLSGAAIGIFIGIGIAAWGWSEKLFDDYNILISLISLVFGIASLFFVFRYLDKVPQSEIISPPPPPPADFDGKD
jgi:MFS family permease